MNKLTLFLPVVCFTISSAFAQEYSFEGNSALDSGRFYLREFRLEDTEKGNEDVTVSCKRVRLKHYYFADSADYGFQAGSVRLALRKRNETGTIGVDYSGNVWLVYIELTDPASRRHTIGTNQFFLAVNEDVSYYLTGKHYHISDQNICNPEVLRRLGPEARLFSN